MGVATGSARYRFGDGARAGVLLGMGMRQAAPLVAGVLWLTVWLMAQLPLVGVLGPIAGAVVAFGRWKRAPLYEIAAPGLRLVAGRSTGRRQWTKAPLLAAGPGLDDHVPVPLGGLELAKVETEWPPGRSRIGLIVDRRAGTMSLVVPVSAGGFPVASALEQDGLVAAWGAALSPLARARCPIARVTWQEWCRPIGVNGHREYLADVRRGGAHAAAIADYERLLAEHAPFTASHDVHVTLTLDMRRIHGRRGRDAAVDVLVEQARQLCSRLDAGTFTTTAPLSANEIAFAVRQRSDPTRMTRLDGLKRSLASAAGYGGLEWGPMAVEPDWFSTRVDESVHRSYQIAGWPMLPVAADWLAPLLTVDGVVRTVTIVMEPVPLASAAADANRQLTSIEADLQQKERHGFRLTAREKRRHDDVETRERELAEGHPLFRHAGFVTVTAASDVALDEACGVVEQAAAQSLLDLRPLAARQVEGWVASLPLGRSVRPGGGWR